MAAIVLSGKGARSRSFATFFIASRGVPDAKTRRREDDDDDVQKKKDEGRTTFDVCEEEVRSGQPPRGC
jgi:IMP cyclohydrolase